MKKVTIHLAFDLGQLVYLRTDKQQLPRFVVGVLVRPGNVIVYDLQHSDEDVTAHHEFEISDEKDFIVNTTN